MNILVLYDETQTFTATVYEHLDSFTRWSGSRVFFAHHDARGNNTVDLHLFDAVVLHYSIRLPFDQISELMAQSLIAYSGLKAVFIQDEYDHTRRAWYWIKRLGIRLVFSSVPDQSMARIYPPAEFPGVRFVSNLTGYAPAALATVGRNVPPSQRPLKIGYRGRALPVRYGALGREKIEIGQLVRTYCEARGVAHDIEWHEANRLYGDKWYEFIASCRAVLGTESGSNVFDWDGSLESQIHAYKADHPRADERQIYEAIVAPKEMPGVMNQVSPRIFEAIACRTALVLFEGLYSGIVEPDVHFIPLRKDGSNLDDVMTRLRDGPAVDAMVERAFDDVLGSGRYSHESFMRMVATEIKLALALNPASALPPLIGSSIDAPALIMRSRPFRRQLFGPSVLLRVALLVVRVVPRPIKHWIKRALRPLFAGK